MAREKSGKQTGAAKSAKNGNGANLGFEAQLFLAADKLRGNLEPSDYKHVALGLIFLKYISDAFEAKRAALLADDPNSAEDPDEYLAENVFWVPKDARWTYLQANAKQPTIGKLIDDAMLAIETKNASLKGVLPKDYNRPALNKIMLGELIDLVSSIAMHEEGTKAKDILGRVYEYFLGGFHAVSKAGSMTRAAAPVVCSFRRSASWKPTADALATSQSMARRAITRHGDSAK